MIKKECLPHSHIKVATSSKIINTKMMKLTTKQHFQMTNNTELEAIDHCRSSF